MSDLQQQTGDWKPTPADIYVNQQAQQITDDIRRLLVDASMGFYRTIFRGVVELRQIALVAGSQPFDGGELMKLFVNLGFDIMARPDGGEWLKAEKEPPLAYPVFAILGRQGVEAYKPDLEYFLEEYYREGHIVFFSQEDFFNYWLFGMKPNYYPGDPRIDEHPGLRFLASLAQYPWPWPKIEALPGEGDVDDSEWQTEHLLKSKFGYTVAQAEGLSSQQRQQILDRALISPDASLDLQTIVEHIAWLVRTRKNMRNRNFKAAIRKWEEDLLYLKHTYYRKEFVWPSSG